MKRLRRRHYHRLIDGEKTQTGRGATYSKYFRELRVAHPIELDIDFSVSSAVIEYFAGSSDKRGEPQMKRLTLCAMFLVIALPVFAQGPEAFVGKWKSDPGTPTMTRELTMEGKTIVMIELQPGRNGGPDLTIIRKYPTDGSEVTMDIGMWSGSKVTGKLEGNVLTCDTTMPNGRKFHDVWTLSEDGKHYTNDMVISGGPPRTGEGPNGAQNSGGAQGNSAGQANNGQAASGQAGQANGGSQNSGSSAPRTVKFSFSKED